MIQLTAIIDDRHATMLTGASIEEAARSCQARFGKRFKGFESIPLSIVARSKWSEYRAKAITRAELEEWLAGRDDEKEIREIFNNLRG